jgi:predicted dehydrogenase
MSNRIRWGILGTGGIANSFAKDLKATGHPVTAVGSRTCEAAGRFATQHGIPKAHGSYEALVHDDQIDVVYVSTPHPFHLSNALLALEAGKHVLVEKPLTINASEARELEAVAKQKGLVALEAMWTRWLPHMVRIREILASGALGELRTLLADHTQKLPDDPAHRINALELGGGALLDLGIYPISFASQLFGKPTSIVATSIPTPTGVDRSTTVILGYNRGRTAVTHCSSGERGPNKAVIIGTEGRLEIDPTWYAATSFTLYSNTNEVTERFNHPLKTRGMEFQADELERLVNTGQLSGTILPIAESVAIMETLDEVRRQIGLKYPGE